MPGDYSEELTRLTVNLVPRSVVALADARALTEDTATDTVNRALQIYSEILHAALEPDRSLEVDLFGDDRLYKIEVKS